MARQLLEKGVSYSWDASVITLNPKPFTGGTTPKAFNESTRGETRGNSAYHLNDRRL